MCVCFSCFICVLLDNCKPCIYRREKKIIRFPFSCAHTITVSYVFHHRLYTIQFNSIHSFRLKIRFFLLTDLIRCVQLISSFRFFLQIIFSTNFIFRLIRLWSGLFLIFGCFVLTLKCVICANQKNAINFFLNWNLLLLIDWYQLSSMLQLYSVFIWMNHVFCFSFDKKIKVRNEKTELSKRLLGGKLMWQSFGKI